MKNLVILNCLDDAKHARLHMQAELKNSLFVSTHASVNDYLDSEGLSCRHLAEFIDYDKIKEIIIEAEETVNSLLDKLDAQLSHRLNSALQIDSLRWFHALYRYIGKYEYIGMRKSYEALKNLMKDNAFDKVYVYRSIATGYYENKNNILEIAKLLHENCYEVDNKDEVKDYFIVDKSPAKDPFVLFAQRFFYKYVRGFPPKVKEAILLFIYAIYGFLFPRKDILLFLPLQDLKFLKTILRKRALLVDINGNCFVVNLSRCDRDALSELKDLFLPDTLLCSESGLHRILINNIILDFYKYLEHNFSVLKGLKAFCEFNTVKLGIWGNPPVYKTKALMVAYLFTKKIKVIGAQHGPLFCEFNKAWAHFESDFNWCDYFLSYGFSEGDLRKTYPGRDKICTIMPVGHVYYPEKNAKYETIDLLFPLTICPSFPMEGVTPKNSEVAENQAKLLRFLNNYRDKRIVIKPFIGSNDKNSSVVCLLKSMDNLEVISNLTLVQVMQRYRVKAFLIDIVASPLCDALFNDEDSQTFVLDNPFFEYYSFVNDFRQKIERSVYIFDDLTMLTKSLSDYFNGSCSGRKDPAYYRRRFYERPDPRNAVVSLIGTLAPDSRGERND